MEPFEILAFNVDRFAEKKQWNRTQVAKGANMNHGQLSLYLSGKKSPGLRALFRLAAALGVAPAELLVRPGEHIDHDLIECAKRLMDLAVKNRG